MLNLLKMDIYRTLRQKSFYVSLAILLFIFFTILNGDGITSNTPFANFHRESDTLVDFLYYFPKTIFMVCGIHVFLALFTCEEYTSGYVKNIYQLHQHKYVLLIERYLYACLICIVFYLAILAVALISNIWIQDPFAGFQIRDYVAYVLTQILLIGAVSSFVMMIMHLLRNKTLTILLSFGYSCMVFFMLHSGIVSVLPESLNYITSTLYYQSGTLPTLFDFGVYAKAIGIVVVNTILYNTISYVALVKKDLT